MKEIKVQLTPLKYPSQDHSVKLSELSPVECKNRGIYIDEEFFKTIKGKTNNKNDERNHDHDCEMGILDSIGIGNNRKPNSKSSPTKSPTKTRRKATVSPLTVEITILGSDNDHKKRSRDQNCESASTLNSGTTPLLNTTSRVVDKGNLLNRATAVSSILTDDSKAIDLNDVQNIPIVFSNQVGSNVNVNEASKDRKNSHTDVSNIASGSIVVGSTIRPLGPQSCSSKPGQVVKCATAPGQLSVKVCAKRNVQVSLLKSSKSGDTSSESPSKSKRASVTQSVAPASAPSSTRDSTIAPSTSKPAQASSQLGSTSKPAQASSQLGSTSKPAQASSQLGSIFKPNFAVFTSAPVTVSKQAATSRPKPEKTLKTSPLLVRLRPQEVTGVQTQPAFKTVSPLPKATFDAGPGEKAQPAGESPLLREGPSQPVGSGPRVVDRPPGPTLFNYVESPPTSSAGFTSVTTLDTEAARPKRKGGRSRKQVLLHPPSLPPPLAEAPAEPLPGLEVRSLDVASLYYCRGVQDERKTFRVARNVTLPLRKVQLIEVACQTDILSMVDPGRLLEVVEIEEDLNGVVVPDMAVVANAEGGGDEACEGPPVKAPRLEDHTATSPMDVDEDNEQPEPQGDTQGFVFNPLHKNGLAAFISQACNKRPGNNQPGNNPTNKNQPGNNPQGNNSSDSNLPSGDDNVDAANNNAREEVPAASSLSFALRLQVYKEWVNCVRPDPFTGDLPLHRAVLKDDVKAVQRQCLLLTGRRISLDTRNYDKKTALHLAVTRGSLGAVSALLASGARPGEADGSGNTALHLAVAAPGTNPALLDALLSAPGGAHPATIDGHNDDGFTALHLCCMHDKPGRGELLLDRGADPDVKDLHSGRTALFLAVEMSRPGLARLLLSASARPPGSHANYAGHTPLHHAWERGDADPEIRLLLERHGEAGGRRRGGGRTTADDHVCPW